MNIHMKIIHLIIPVLSNRISNFVTFSDDKLYPYIDIEYTPTRQNTYFSFSKTIRMVAIS